MNNQLSPRWLWGRRLASALVVGVATQAMAGWLQLGSVPGPSPGPPASGNGDSWASVISPDGRYVLFASTANNLTVLGNGQALPLLSPAKLNVFLRDRTNQTTALVSVNLSGTGGGNDDSMPVGLSTNGQYVLFESRASDLVAGDTNSAADIFRRDLVAGRTELVSVGLDGAPGNGESRGSVMTPDGRYIAFASEASDLVPDDTNGIADVFVRDMEGGTTTLVSVGAQSSWTDLGGSEAPVITPDGRYVAFYSGATNLVAGGTNTGDIYVRDVVGGTTTWASVYARTAVQAALGTADAFSCSHVLSEDGQWVAYQANPAGFGWATNGVVLRYNLGNGLTDVIHTNAVFRTGAPEDLRSLDMTPDGRFVAFLANTNSRGTVPPFSCSDACVLVWDGQSGTTSLASGDANNNVPTNSICAWPAITPDGRFVLFLSNATNLVANAPTNGYHVYRRDLQGGTTTLVDANANGLSTINGPGTVPQMTPDGRWVAFESPDSSLVAGDRNHGSDVLVCDLAAGTMELISARSPLAALSVTPVGSSQPSALSLSADGRYLAFASDADDLVAGDTNNYRDVFVRDLLLGTNLLVSVATNGSAGDGPSFDPIISGDGRYVAFSSGADNLVGGDTNNKADVFIRDLQAGTTALVSVSAAGAGSGNGASYLVARSANGRFVLFRSTSTNLASGSFSHENLFLRDMQAGTTYALTQSGGSYIYSGLCPNAMTPDGRYMVCCEGWFLNGNVYVWDSLSASRQLISGVGSVGGEGLGFAITPDGRSIIYSSIGVGPNNATLYATSCTNWSLPPKTNWTIGSFSTTTHPGLRFSGDGRFLTYVCGVKGTNLVSYGGTNQIYLYDMQYRTNFLVSHACNSSGPGSGPSDWPEISSDGRFIAFHSAAPDLVPGDTNGVPDIFLYDRQSNTTTLVSVNQLGTAAGNSRSMAPVFSGDGQTLVFESWASDLVMQDLNHSSDLFAWHLSDQIPGFFASVTGGSQGPCLVWPVMAGKSYRVQYKNSLSEPAWQELNGNVTIQGNQGYLNDTTAGNSPRFYRVVAY